MTFGKSRHRMMHSTALAASLITALIAGPAFGQGQTYSVDIPSEPLSSALRDFAKTSGQQIVFTESMVSGRSVGPLHGNYSIDAALNKLLAGTGLSFSRASNGGIVIQSKSALAAPADPGTSGPAAIPVESVMVTAEKRSERLSDAPIPVTVLQPAALLNTDQVQLKDYYSMVPGLSVTSQGFRDAPVLAIRGITTGSGSNPTVGVVLDDVPLGASTNLGGGTLAPDIDPSELASIQVLRGPQGTLYGASSMGGLLSYTTIDPTTDQFYGSAQSGLNTVSHSGSVGYSVRGNVNIPVTDTFALRASAFSRFEPGFIDDTSKGLTDLNESRYFGGRLVGLWAPADDFVLKVSALFQQGRTDGSPYADPSLGDLNQNNARNTGWSDRQLQVYTANAAWSLEGVKITSVTGYSQNLAKDSIDFSALFGTGEAIPERNQTSKLTEELRFSGTIAGNFDWLVGGFYDQEISRYVEAYNAVNYGTGQVTSAQGTSSFPSTYQEYAIFADFVYHITDKFDLQFGARESENRQTYDQTILGSIATSFYGQPSPFVSGHVARTADAFTYLVTPKFQINDDLMVYARLASGYRPGSINLFAAHFGFPVISKPDKTTNYELGVKGDVFDHRVTFDASLYHIDWTDIQLTVVDPATFNTYYVNASRAKSEGLEVSAQAKPTGGLTLSGWVTLSNAELTQPLPAGSFNAVGSPGDPLPYTSHFSVNASAEQVIPITADVSGFLGGTLSYVGNRKGDFGAAAVRQNLGAYTKVDLRAGVNFDNWSAEFFANNVTDERGRLSGGTNTYFPNEFTYITPRTVGINLKKTF